MSCTQYSGSTNENQVPPTLPLTLVLILILGMFGAALAQQQRLTTRASRVWSVDLTVGSYLVPDDWHLQPTVIADRGGLHLESRYNYEGRESLAGLMFCMSFDGGCSAHAVACAISTLFSPS